MSRLWALVPTNQGIKGDPPSCNINICVKCLVNPYCTA